MAENKPDFLILANKAKISTAIKNSLVSLSITDASGFESDTLEIVLDATGIEKPAKGAELEVHLGYTGDLVKMGLYVVDEVTISGWPTTITIRARGTPFSKSKLGLVALHSQKTRTWARDTKIDAVIAKIAKEHNLTPLVSKSLQGIDLPQFDQTAESDISFLVRLGRRYDAIVKPGGGKLAMFRRGDFEMPSITIDAVDATNWSYIESSRDTGGTVVAFWHSKANAERKQVEVGSGDPVKQLRHWYPDEASAKAAAKAEHDRRSRGAAEFWVTVPGNPRLSADNRLVPQGFFAGIPKLFVIKSVTHRLNHTGFSSDVQAELPNE